MYDEDVQELLDTIERQRATLDFALEILHSLGFDLEDFAATID
jgi:hypothetical protein